MFHVTNHNGITVSVIDAESMEGIEVTIPEGGKLNEGQGILLGRGNEPRPACPGDDYVFDETIFAWVLPPENVTAWDRDVRLRRQILLAQSDWTQLPDVHIADKEAWAVYRQALRDITEQPGFPTDVVWPEAP